MAKFDPAFLDEIRRAVPISEIIGRYVIWDRRKTQPSRGDWWAPCMFHGEKSPSFHCEDAKGRYFCFGCGASGDHFRFLTEIEGMSFPAAVAFVGEQAGIKVQGGRDERTEEERAAARAAWAAKKRREEAAKEAEERRRTRSAGRLWHEAVEIAGTPAEAYLAQRGLPAWQEKELRFHPSCWHEFARVSRPAVIGRVVGPDRVGIAVWRIFIKPDGSDKLYGKGERFDSKLGKGPAAGGAVRLGGDAKIIGIAEGVETARAAFLLDGRCPVWAGLSTSGMIGFEPPAFVETIYIYPDGDKPRRRDGIDYGPPGLEAATRLKQRMDERGLACFIVDPPPPGMDFLDLWVSRNASK